MAEEKAAKPAEEASPSTPKKWFWKRIKLRGWLGTILVISLTLNVAQVALLGSPTRGKTQTSPEVSLGKFRFVNDELEGTRILEAEFDLYIKLLSDIDRTARPLLTTRKFKIQQDVEELLRQAHGADFEDPTLAELKRQLQEKINQSLEMRAIEQVIVTRLATERAAAGDEAVQAAEADVEPAASPYPAARAAASPAPGTPPSSG